MDSSVAAAALPPAPAPRALDARTLLARINLRIALLRSWMSHDHGDDRYWWARRMDARYAQWERAVLRQVANLLHVERATARGRLHGTRFADLDAQKAWLAGMEHRSCGQAATLAGVDAKATLAKLRAGELPL